MSYEPSVRRVTTVKIETEDFYVELDKGGAFEEITVKDSAGKLAKNLGIDEAKQVIALLQAAVAEYEKPEKIQ